MIIEKVPGEAISESHDLSLFLRGIKDPDFETTVEIQNNKDDNNLMKYMIDIRKQEREGHKERVYIEKIQE